MEKILGGEIDELTAALDAEERRLRLEDQAQRTS
jgi:hypothetical protein